MPTIQRLVDRYRAPAINMCTVFASCTQKKTDAAIQFEYDVQGRLHCAAFVIDAVVIVITITVGGDVVLSWNRLTTLPGEWSPHLPASTWLCHSYASH